ncbi:lipopolysaccharide biosynthesis protein [Paenibacillus sp. MWE-103]|uniref:Lipopolysaccharide biosynthesis protein n=1 Tax=Paenibacillus artemisiicola TaxID=1172618 RepID=A0ABS3WHM1_9BACL|nr:Wzz/FepE/Etk N-terminal domain-containing protein [Paenibacillus artemisiicola]MBO7747819.1 lipopolysaccharide biosynthesis protein [Paenibacillus artemisiicola]
MELKQFMNVIRKKLILIISIVLVVCVLTGIKSFLFTTDVYQASAKLIVNQSYVVNGAEKIDSGSIQTNIMLISSYKEIIKSSAILDKVVSGYPDLKVTPSEISSRIAVSASDKSQVMNLSYTDSSYEHAVKVVNAVATVFKNEIPSIMKVDNVTILSKANASEGGGAINTSPVVLVVISFIVSLMLSIGLVFLLDYLDDTIKTEEDVIQALQLPMLSYIKKISKADMKKSGKRAIQKQVGEGVYATK